MNILITGNLSSLATTLVKELSKQKHRFVLVSDNADQLGIKSDGVIVHSVDPAGGIFRDAMSSYGFDVVIFISTREEQLLKDANFNTGHQLDGLWNTLELCKQEKPKHFFYVSSTEVYGDVEDRSEKIDPQPSSINGYTLLAGEQYCQSYHIEFGVNVTILRLTNVYGPDEKGGLLYNLILACEQEVEADVFDCETAAVSLLHASDVADFFIRAMDEPYTPDSLIVNLSVSKPIRYAQLTQLLQTYYPTARFNYRDDKSACTKPATVSAAKKIYDWTDTFTFQNEVENIVETVRSTKADLKPHPTALQRELFHYPEILKWIELIGGAALTQFLSQMTGTLIQFKYVDFRLLFVVIMASIYGIRIGLYAAILVSLSILYTWVQFGFDWALLIYNVGNWLPFALYFTAGMITGYYHDKSENEILNAHKQAELIHEKYSFLYGVFNDIRNLKDEFRERLLGYRDSFGKIFTITRELDELHEEAIYLRALSILEEQMENTSVAIYSLAGKQPYARLEANSASLHGKLSKSLDLSAFPELLPHIEQGTIFQNTALLPDYPAYVVPIFNNTYPFNVATALIVIWSVKFDQYTTYYYNLLKVLGGLIQASLVRATQFSNANYEKMYVPTTRILNHDAFMDALRARMEMKRNRVSDFQLVAAEMDSHPADVYSCISEGIRTTDIIGMGNNGNFYVLLPQAGRPAAEDIIERLSKHGIQSKLVDANEIAPD